jgi:hypothetical protein
MSSYAESRPTASLRYPIGHPRLAAQPTADEIRRAIDAIHQLPFDVQIFARALAPGQLGHQVYPCGWTVTQIMHHLADAHLLGYLLSRAAVLPDSEPISLPPARTLLADPDKSTRALRQTLPLLMAVHCRWSAWLETLEAPAFTQAFGHPRCGSMPLGRALQWYAWHGEHHLAQVEQLARRRGWLSRGRLARTLFGRDGDGPASEPTATHQEVQ